MLFLELGQKELILVVIQGGKKGKENQCMYWGRGRLKSGVQAGVTQRMASSRGGMLKLAPPRQDAGGTYTEEMDQQNPSTCLHSSRPCYVNVTSTNPYSGLALGRDRFLPIVQIKIGLQEVV